MEFSGRIIAVLPPKSGVGKATGNEWKAQEYVIESHEQYPKRMCFEVFGGDKIQQFNIQLNEEIIVSFDIDARQWQDRWFNSIRAWKVERERGVTGEPSPATNVAYTPTSQPSPTITSEFTQGDANDDLPF
ncbi:hypothetical protein EZS27_016361 [termite gut metagenome]|uniref:DUF3127 domain-containing protein n=1 Tax=termite gut metagenome TaxID=433724 RepID=A0A5J4RQS0_9ZZZZ